MGLQTALGIPRPFHFYGNTQTSCLAHTPGVLLLSKELDGRAWVTCRFKKIAPSQPSSLNHQNFRTRGLQLWPETLNPKSLNMTSELARSLLPHAFRLLDHAQRHAPAHTIWGSSQNQGYHFGGPHNKAYSVLGSPYFGKLPF